MLFSTRRTNRRRWLAQRVSLSLGIAVLTLTSTALPADEPAAPAVSLERRGYAAISLQSPSQSGEPAPTGRALRPAPGSEDADGTRRSAAMPLVTIGSSLAVVLGLFAALVWVSKKSGVAAHRSGTIPDEALRLLGQKSLGTAGSIALIRCGRRVLVVGLSAAGMQPLAEITDEEQVRNLETLCLGESPASFREVLGDLQLDPAAGGFVGEDFSKPPARRKLFAEG